MNTHYIPRLLLKNFAENDWVNSFDYKRKEITQKRTKNVFAGEDLFDPELEKAFATKLEGPVGDLIHHKLLEGDRIEIDRRENQLLRKFCMINFLRAPIVNCTWDEMVERMQLKDHPSVQRRDFLIRHHPEMKEMFDRAIPSSATYHSDLKRAMEIDLLEDMSVLEEGKEISITLKAAVKLAMVSTIAFWDTEGSGQEFILPKLPGIQQMDQVSTMYKMAVLRNRKKELEENWLPEDLESEINRMMFGSAIFSENYGIYPLSPTRVIICFSPYFRAFFPVMNAFGNKVEYPPLLKEEQFQRHFFESMRMELFKPCQTIRNERYQYKVKYLTDREVWRINSIQLDMETEEFVFHDYEKIRDSLRYYDREAKIAPRKKHDFSLWE